MFPDTEVLRREPLCGVFSPQWAKCAESLGFLCARVLARRRTLPSAKRRTDIPKGNRKNNLPNETAIGRELVFYTDDDEKYGFIKFKMKAQGETKNGNAIRIASTLGAKLTLAYVDGQNVKINLNVTTNLGDED